MRDIALTVTFAIVLYYIFRRPHLGVLAWGWISILNPHLHTFGFSNALPFNMVLALATIVSWLMSKENKRPPSDPWFASVMALTLWVSVTTLTAQDFTWSGEYWWRYVKTIVFVFMCLVLITTRERIHAFILALAMGIGFYALKGGVFTVLTGGQNRVLGPHGTYIGDNNHLALAMVISIPILNYLRLYSAHRWMRVAMAVGMGVTILAVLGTYSRGGFVAIVAMLGFLWLKSRHKMVTGAIAVAMMIPAYVFMPEKYTERVSTISEAKSDSSFQGRMNSWVAATRHSLESPVGAGFNGVQLPTIYYRYISPEHPPRAAHSIYFQVLGDHGFPGLALYLVMGWLAWRNGTKTIRACRDDPALAWARELAAMLQVSMVGFFVGGAALSMAYFDYFLAILAVQACLRRIVAEPRSRQGAHGRWSKPIQAPSPSRVAELTHPRFARDGLASPSRSATRPT